MKEHFCTSLFRILQPSVVEAQNKWRLKQNYKIASGKMAQGSGWLQKGGKSVSIWAWAEIFN